jgi:hypothetical protein
MGLWYDYYAPMMGRGSGKKGRNNQTNDRQAILENMYLRVLGELAMNRFEWKGFEGTGVDTRFLEMMLYFHALAVVFRDDSERDADGNIIKVGTGQIFALRGAPSGTKNLVDNPVAFTLTGSNFQGARRTIANCVPIWSNYFRSPDLDIVTIYANKLATIDRTIEINSENARRSKILTYNENSTLTAKNINDMLNRGEATIPVNFNLGDMITALDLGIDPKSIESLSVLRSRIWNECMGLLGINNSNQDKKERLVESEVGANNDQIASSRRVNLNARQEAASKINAMFELDVSVDYYTDMPVETLNPATNEQTGSL